MHPGELLPSQRPSRARLIIPFAAAGLIVACVAVLLQSRQPQHTVAQIARQITQTALTRSTTAGVDDGGLVGAWWISAGGADPATGEFQNLVIRGGPMLLGARRAALVIDPYADAFSFELWDVVFTRLEDAATSPEGIALRRSDHLVLGPVKYAIDIVPDGRARESVNQ